MTKRQPDNSEFRTHPSADPSSNDVALEGSAFSRRDFIVEAGRLGLLMYATPRLGGALLRSPSALTALGTPPEQQVAALAPGLKWRMLGPFRGGRVDAVSGVPGRPNEFYFGAVNGGVWKTIDAGRVWTPVFDSQPVASIGALAVAPSAPDIVYVGSGESTLRDSMGYGNGMYKSTDAGKTWTHIGLDDTQHIGKIAVDPKNPNIVFVAAIGHLYAANPERGVFRSRDGGKTWKKVLFKNDNVGAVEVVIDPTNSQVVYAGLWNTRRPPWYTYAPTNGPGGGIFKSTDGGTTWKQLTNGLPKEGIGRTGIAIAPSNPRRVYAVVDCLVPEPNAPPPAPADGGGGRGGGDPACAQRPAPPGQGGFFRSDDAGATWTQAVGRPGALGTRLVLREGRRRSEERGHRLRAERVRVALEGRRQDVGAAARIAGRRRLPPGVGLARRLEHDDRRERSGRDHHAQRATDDPRDVTWSSWLNQPTAQIYHLSVDYRFPYWVTGAQQDSRRRRRALARQVRRDLDARLGADRRGRRERHDRGRLRCTRASSSAAPGSASISRRNAPVPRHDGAALAATARAPTGRSRSCSRRPIRRRSTTRISSCSRRPMARRRGRRSAPISRAPIPAFRRTSTRRRPRRSIATASAASSTRSRRRRSPRRLLWIGTDDGLIQVTTDDGKTWQNVTPPALTPWSRVTTIEASHFDANGAYASVDRHQLQDFEPYIYRTRDMGKTWQKITNGLPAGVYVHVVKEDPERRGLLFAGTERGAFVSFDDGDSWQPLQLNLPVTSVRDFEIYDNDLIVATHGRGFWVDRRHQPAAPDQRDGAGVGCVPVQAGRRDHTCRRAATTARRCRRTSRRRRIRPNGAAIDYYLKSNATGPVSIEILDASGTVVATFSTNAAGGGAGFGGGRRARWSRWWDSEHVGALASHARALRDDGRRASCDVGAGRWRRWSGSRRRWRRGGGGGSLTGTFTARLSAGGQTYTQTFNVREAPQRAR